jgi:hypothetical protein
LAQWHESFCHHEDLWFKIPVQIKFVWTGVWWPLLALLQLKPPSKPWICLAVIVLFMARRMVSFLLLRKKSKRSFVSELAQRAKQ